MPGCLVTGGSGFLGGHLLRQLRTDWPAIEDLIAVGRRRPEHCPSGSFRPIDLEDRAQVIKLVDELAPSVVFHLAGKTPPGDPQAYYRQNTLATVHLLDALRGLNRPCRLVLAGSAAELGPVPVELLPVAEDHSCRPADSYGLSKWLATCAGLASGPPLEVVIARIFNPIGPGLPSSQALGRFADELARGLGPICLSVGDIEARRDFIDVRDVARALIALSSRGQPGRVYHVGTGRSQRVGDGLDRLIGLSGRDARIEVDPGRFPARGPLDSRADVRRIASEVGWSAEIPWERSLQDLWDNAVARAGARVISRSTPEPTSPHSNPPPQGGEGTRKAENTLASGSLPPCGGGPGWGDVSNHQEPLKDPGAEAGRD